MSQSNGSDGAAASATDRAVTPEAMAGVERVLVTGAAGFIGSHLSERLLDEGVEVWGLDNFDAFYEPRIKRRNLRAALSRSSFHFVEGDIRDGVLLGGLLSDVGFDAVVHLAARPGARPSLDEPAACFEANVMGTITLLEAMQVHHVRRFIFASCGSVYGGPRDVPFREDDRADRPTSPFAASKRTGELLCHTYHHLYGFSTYCLRLFSVYGPRQRPDSTLQELVGLLDDRRPVPVNRDRASVQDLTHVDDVVDGLVRVLVRSTRADADPEFEILNLGTGLPTTLTELIELLAAVLDVEPQIESSDTQPRQSASMLAPPTRAESILGWRPRRSVPEGLQSFVDWYRESSRGSDGDGDVAGERTDPVVVNESGTRH